jgi:hypothetical protein
LPGANPTRAETMFHFAWPSLGLDALLLVPVSLVAGVYCRPWRGHLTWLVALGLLVFARRFLSWAGGTWLLTAFLVSGWISWCADRLTERLLQNEGLLTWALQPQRTEPTA